MARKKGSDDFLPNGPRPLGSFKPISNIIGSDKKSQLLRPLPFKRRFRPAINTKDFSVVSEYNYASLWSRWRRGYELSMYAQGAYSGLIYSSFKYYVSGTAGVGGYIPGLFFVYPTLRSDMRMHMVGIRPRDTFNFLDFGISIQSVTHLDYSARVQTVHKNTNPRYWSLINSFKELTGYGILVNTSFNVRGEPIVCNPLDAFKCFMSTEMDYLVVGDFVYTKHEQIDANNLEKWRTNFKKD